MNRYERKKNILLAVLAFKELLDRENKSTPKLMLVIAGGKECLREGKIASKSIHVGVGVCVGYDTRVEENVSYYAEIEAYVHEHQLADK